MTNARPCADALGPGLASRRRVGAARGIPGRAPTRMPAASSATCPASGQERQCRREPQRAPERIARQLGRREAPLRRDPRDLAELGYLVIETAAAEPHAIRSVRLHTRGVDIHEQLALQKYVPPATAAH